MKSSTSVVCGMLLLALAFCASGSGRPRQLAVVPEFEPRSVCKNDRIVIVWSCSEWPDALLGFNIHRRLAGADDKAWRKISANPVRPDLTLAHVDELGLVGLDKRIRLARVHEMPSAIAMQFLREISTEPWFAVIWYDLELAQALGIAYADVDVMAGQEYEYRVTPLFGGGEEGPALCIVRARAEESVFSCPPRNFTATRLSERSVRLSWEVDSAELRRNHVAGFRMYRATESEPLEAVAPTYVLPTKGSEGKPTRAYECDDMVPLAEGQKYGYTYAVRPVEEVTKREGEFSLRIRVVRPLPAMPSPKVTAVNWADGKGIVQWDYEPGVIFQGFKVERLVGDKAQDVNLIDGEVHYITPEPLGPEVRQYVDEDTPRQPGMLFTYRVWAVAGDYRMDIPSADYVPCRVPFAPPPSPTDLSMERGFLDGHAVFRLKWLPAKTADPVEYVVEEAWEDYPAWRAAGTFKEPSAVVDIHNAPPGQNRGYRVKASVVVGKTAFTGGVSAPSNEVWARTFRSTAPDPVALGTLVDNDGVTYVRWSYPVSPAWAGFRVYVDGKCVADEKTLGPFVREYFVQNGVVKKDREIQVTAVDELGRESAKGVPKVTEAEPAPRNNIPPPPVINYKKAVIKTQVDYFGNEKKQKEVEYQYVDAPDGRKWFHGDMHTYRPDGQPESWLHYEEGKMHGIQRYYIPKGAINALYMVFIFDHGRQTTHAAFEKIYGNLPLTPEELHVLRNADDHEEEHR